MILYNVTISIDDSISDDWLRWMQIQHVPDVMSTGCFSECRISKIHGEEEGGKNFSIMYLCPNQETLDNYQNNFAPKLQAEHTQRYQGKFAAFRTYLTVIEEFKTCK